ncbi:MAG: hypothetical protein OXR66_04540 [Candidatus Woesearchaeota archaeon]|nr:hypothetical protein [Candidatus Woesearchaeota archaeon]
MKLVLVLLLLLTSCTVMEELKANFQEEEQEKPAQIIQEEPKKLVNECNYDEETLSFTITNTGTMPWNIDNAVGLEDTGKVAGLNIFINDFAVNDESPIINGKRMFGPEALLSDNCDGERTLQPGDTVSCSLQPVPVQSRKGKPTTNTFTLHAQGHTVEETFACA